MVKKRLIYPGVGFSPPLPVSHLACRYGTAGPPGTIVRRLPVPAGVDRSGLAENYWLERLPLLAELLGLEAKETALTRNLSDDLRRDNIFAAIRAIILEGKTRRRPTLILLEDTHWSDELSLELAAHLAAGRLTILLSGWCWLIALWVIRIPSIYQRLLVCHTTAAGGRVEPGSGRQTGPGQVEGQNPATRWPT
ncbi:MAG: hypothetical protein U0401_05385 [Anaerolineae bacterium]